MTSTPKLTLETVLDETRVSRDVDARREAQRSASRRSASRPSQGAQAFSSTLFLEFLRRSHCEENLDFILATDPYLAAAESPRFQLQGWDRAVYSQFIRRDSPRECNLPQHIRETFDVCHNSNTAPSRHNIEAARQHVLALLRDAFSKFRDRQRRCSLPQCTSCDRRVSGLSPPAPCAFDRQFAAGKLQYHNNSSYFGDCALDDEEDEDEDDTSNTGRSNDKDYGQVLVDDDDLDDSTDHGNRVLVDLGTDGSLVTTTLNTRDSTGTSPGPTSILASPVITAATATNAALGSDRNVAAANSSLPSTPSSSFSTSSSAGFGSLKLKHTGKKLVNKFKFRRSSSGSSGSSINP